MTESIFIDIPYEELKKAVVEAEKKEGTCDILPHGRFRFNFIRDCGLGIRRIQENDGQRIKFDLIVCEALDGLSTGTSADECKNCVYRKCPHKRTKKIKCKEKECPDFGKFHVVCRDCGLYVDIAQRRKKAFKKLSSLMNVSSKEKSGGGNAPRCKVNKK